MVSGMHPWSGLSEEVRLGVLTEWVPAGVVDEAPAECGRRDTRPGALPARFMASYTLALALFQQDSCDDVAEHMVGAVEGRDEAIPNKSSITRARQRLGTAPLEAVFRTVAGAVAPRGLAGAFYQGMRIAWWMGSCWMCRIPRPTGRRSAARWMTLAGRQGSRRSGW